MQLLKVKKEKYPERCEICHQKDYFDREKNICVRCNKRIVNPKEKTQISAYQFIKELKCKVIEDTKEKIVISLSKFSWTDCIVYIISIGLVINCYKRYYFTDYWAFVLLFFIVWVYGLINRFFSEDMLIFDNKEIKIASGLTTKSILKTITLAEIKELDYRRKWFSDQLVVKLSTGKEEILFSRTDDKAKILALKNFIELKIDELNKKV